MRATPSPTSTRRSGSDTSSSALATFPRWCAQPATASVSRPSRAVRYDRPSPITTACARSGSACSFASRACGAMFLPLERDDEVLLAPGDVQVAVGVEPPEVSRVHPPLVVDQLRRPLGILEVALAHRVASHEDLAITGDPDLDAWQREANRPDPDAAGRVEAGRPAVLGLAVDLAHRQPDAVEPGEERRVRPARRRTRAPGRVRALTPAGSGVPRPGRARRIGSARRRDASDEGRSVTSGRVATRSR